MDTKEQINIKEQAEIYAYKQLPMGCFDFDLYKQMLKIITKTYLDAYKKGNEYSNKPSEDKPKWHDLKKNPNDLPNTNREVLVLLWDYNNYHIGRYEEEYDDVIREDTYWHFDDFSIGKDKLDTVLGWFELPKVKR